MDLTEGIREYVGWVNSRHRKGEKEWKKREVWAPVILFTYNRPEHTKRTIEALAANELAAETDL